jgi:hypothetical protein
MIAVFYTSCGACHAMLLLPDIDIDPLLLSYGHRILSE